MQLHPVQKIKQFQGHVAIWILKTNSNIEDTEKYISYTTVWD